MEPKVGIVLEELGIDYDAHYVIEVLVDSCFTAQSTKPSLDGYDL